MRLIFSFTIIGLVLLSGCGSTRVTSVWKAADVLPSHYNKIMVVGIIREADRSMRESMENHLVGDLQSLGYNASSSLAQYGPKAFQDMTEEEVAKKLKGEGIEAVVTIVLLDKQRERHYIPGRIMYSPYGLYQGRFWGYYRSIYSRIEMPGYYQVTTNYFWESNLYDLTSEKLIFSVQTKSFDPSSTGSLAHEYGKLILKSMVRNGVLKSQTDKVVKAM